MAHWYNPLWNPGTTNDPGFQTQLCASETPASPLPLSLIDLGVPSADSLSGQIRCCASKEKKKIKRKIIVNPENVLQCCNFCDCTQEGEGNVYAQVHRSGMVKSLSLQFSQHCGQFEFLASQQANNTSTDVHNLSF
jgi:hypothetical protein